MSHLLIFGYGYTGSRFGKFMRAKGWQVTGTTREPASVKNLLQWPGENVDQAIDAATHLLICTAPDANGDPVLARLQKQISEAHFDWAGYLSTTGVYGDHRGGWVDENSPLNPATTRGHHRVAAENQWLDLFRNHDLPLHIFRLAGIYGPDRGPFTKVRNGTARRIIKRGQVFSRAHVDDILQTLHASVNAPNPGRIYNVCDNDPAPPQDVIAEAARLLNLPVPPEIPYDQANLTPMARSFYAESKKVSNNRIKAELGVSLSYPDYHSGLNALLEQEQQRNHLAKRQKSR